MPAEEVERRIDQVARSLGRDMKMPGFRTGKVPPPVVIQRLGREVVLDEAIRATLGRWYVDAVETSGIHPVGDPDLDARRPGRRGRAADLHLRDRRAPGRDARRRTRASRRRAASPQADEDTVTAQIDELRERMSRLETVEDAAGEGDFVVMDYVGTLVGEDEPFEGGDRRATS